MHCDDTETAFGDIQVEASPRDMRKVMMRGRKVAAWRRLSLPERDVLTVLSAICKVCLLSWQSTHHLCRFLVSFAGVHYMKAACDPPQ